jgi:hypothetical protein
MGYGQIVLCVRVMCLYIVNISYYQYKKTFNDLIDFNQHVLSTILFNYNVDSQTLEIDNRHPENVLILNKRKLFLIFHEIKNMFPSSRKDVQPFVT